MPCQKTIYCPSQGWKSDLTTCHEAHHLVNNEDTVIYVVTCGCFQGVLQQSVDLTCLEIYLPFFPGWQAVTSSDAIISEQVYSVGNCKVWTYVLLLLLNLPKGDVQFRREGHDVQFRREGNKKVCIELQHSYNE
jgi:hypothetical protein